MVFSTKQKCHKSSPLKWQGSHTLFENLFCAGEWWHEDCVPQTQLLCWFVLLWKVASLLTLNLVGKFSFSILVRICLQNLCCIIMSSGFRVWNNLSLYGFIGKCLCRILWIFFFVAAETCYLSNCFLWAALEANPNLAVICIRHGRPTRTLAFVNIPFLVTCIVVSSGTGTQQVNWVTATINTSRVIVFIDVSVKLWRCWVCSVYHIENVKFFHARCVGST